MYRCACGLHRYVVGLVPQEDSMHGWLTVEENLWLYARLRRRSSRPISATQSKVTSIMKVLGLYAHRNARCDECNSPFKKKSRCLPRLYLEQMCLNSQCDIAVNNHIMRSRTKWDMAEC
jgi:hypothetical protein